MTALWILLAALALFVVVLLVRTAQFRPRPQEPVQPEPVALNEEKIVADMADMIRCKTVSHRDSSLVDWEEFRKFRALFVCIQTVTFCLQNFNCHLYLLFGVVSV